MSKIIQVQHQQQDVNPTTVTQAILHKDELLYDVLEDILTPKPLFAGNAININDNIISVTSHEYDEEQNSSSFGKNNTLNGINSIAQGFSNTVAADNSHAEGIGTITSNDAEHAEGKYNKSNQGTMYSIGIGTADNDRKNAVEVLDNGDTYIYGIGGYDGSNLLSATRLQDCLGSEDQTALHYGNNIFTEVGSDPDKGDIYFLGYHDYRVFGGQESQGKNYVQIKRDHAQIVGECSNNYKQGEHVQPNNLTQFSLNPTGLELKHIWGASDYYSGIKLRDNLQLSAKETIKFYDSDIVFGRSDNKYVKFDVARFKVSDAFEKTDHGIHIGGFDNNRSINIVNSDNFRPISIITPSNINLIGNTNDSSNKKFTNNIIGVQIRPNGVTPGILIHGSFKQKFFDSTIHENTEGYLSLHNYTNKGRETSDFFQKHYGPIGNGTDGTIVHYVKTATDFHLGVAAGEDIDLVQDDNNQHKITIVDNDVPQNTTDYDVLCIKPDGRTFVRGVGGFDGTNSDVAQTLQDVLQGGGGLSPQTAVVIAAALNDLNERLLAIENLNQNQ